VAVSGGKRGVAEADHRHRLLLRVHRERPRRRRAAEQSDELPSVAVDTVITVNGIF